MKKYLLELKWVILQVRPFILEISLLIITAAIISLSGVGFALASRALIDTATGSNMGGKILNSELLLAGIVMALIIILQISLQAAYGIINTRTLEKMGNKIRNVMFEKLLKSNISEFSAYHSGDVVTRMTSDASNVTGAITGMFPDTVALGVQLLAAFIALYSFDRVMAVLAFLIGPILLLSSRVFARKIRTLHIKCQEGESLTRSFLQEVLQNLITVKAFNLEKKYAEHMKGLQANRMLWVVKRSWMSVASGVGMSLGFWMGYFLALSWGSYRLSQGTITFGTMTVFLQLVGQVQGPFLGLARSVPRVVSMLASASRLLELDRLPLEQVPADNICDNMPNPKYNLKTANYGLEISDVTFGYKQDIVVIENISLKIHPGETVAITGLSGVGKTTLIKLLLAFVLPESGDISLTQGNEIRKNISAETRRFFSYVPQGNTLFSGTIKDNLLIGDTEASDEELEACSRMACAWEFILELPDGLSTRLGENGHGLSEGQAQRIAISRALLRKAPILLLDEGTSALDANTEAKVLKAIKDGSPKRTCIIITHRKAVMEYCDRVIRVEDKQVYEEIFHHI